MANNEDRKKLAEKVRNLFAKAKNVAGTPEADAFNAKAFELVIKYDLTEAELNPGASLKDASDDGKLKRVKFAFSDQYARQRIELRWCVARPLHCAGLMTDNSTAMILFGVQRHIRRVRLLVSYLEPQMIAGAAHALAKEGISPFHVDEAMAFRQNWMAGFAAEVGRKVAMVERSHIQQADMNAGDTSKALARESDKTRAERAKDKEFPPFLLGNAGSAGYGAGYSAGAAAGRAADVGQTRVGGGGRRAIG